MEDLYILEALRFQMEAHEWEAFHRRITSLDSNLNYWNAHPEFSDSKTEFNKCIMLRQKATKDLQKAVDKLGDKDV
jgi:hypothetical protein